MFSRVAPSFWACLTEEFMNTVQRLPKVHGPLGEEAQLRKLLHVLAQGLGEGLQEAAAAGGAGLVQEDVADGPCSILKHFMSWPPMSMMKSTLGRKCLAAVKWATVSTTP